MYVWLGWDFTAWSVLFLPDEAQNRLVYFTVFNFNNKYKAWLIARNVTAHRLMITILAPLLYKENNANAAIWLAWSQKQLLFFFLRISFLCCRCFYITKRRPHSLLPVHQEAGVESRESSANASEQRYASNTLYTSLAGGSVILRGIFCLSVPWEGCSQESCCKK